jgi:hypothetical protein
MDDIQPFSNKEDAITRPTAILANLNESPLKIGYLLIRRVSNKFTSIASNCEEISQKITHKRT